MGCSAEQIGHREDFPAFWNRLFRVLIRWLCIYPSLLIIIYEVYHWLRFAEFLGLETYKIAPPRLLGLLYNLTDWEGANMLIFKFLQLPICLTMPAVLFIVTYSVFQIVLAFYYLGQDGGKLARWIMDRFS